VLDTAVKCQAYLVCLERAKSEREDIGISPSPYEITKRKSVSTVISEGSCLVDQDESDLLKVANNDVIVTHVRRRGEKTTRMVNVWHQTDALSGERERPAQKLNWQRVIL